MLCASTCCPTASPSFFSKFLKEAQKRPLYSLARHLEFQKTRAASSSTKGRTPTVPHMPPSFSAVTARVCTATGKTVITAAHSGAAAARPQLCAAAKAPSARLPLPAHRFLKASSQPALPAAAAICTMGARGGRLRESLELRIRAESGSTLMIDSTTPVRLSPASPAGTEYGIGIHAGVESGALLVITPDAHVPCREAHTGLWTRYDLSPSASLVSVQLADLNEQEPN
jgi:hypothetical protein